MAAPLGEFPLSDKIGSPGHELDRFRENYCMRRASATSFRPVDRLKQREQLSSAVWIEVHHVCNPPAEMGAEVGMLLAVL